jgi:membrane protein YqaA with SNARE-associated domain
MLRRFVEWLKPIAAGMGGPGLLLIGFLDSSFLAFPGVMDFLIVWLTARAPAWWMYYAAMGTAGSTAGCYALYAVAKRGGEAFVRRRLKQSTFDRGLVTVRKYGLLAVIVPSLLPPPAPFKVFIILAGLAEIAPGPFTLAVVLGRGLRYGAEALLAYKYGEPALEFINKNVSTISLWVAICIVAFAALWFVWHRLRKK